MDVPGGSIETLDESVGLSFVLFRDPVGQPICVTLNDLDAAVCGAAVENYMFEIRIALVVDAAHRFFEELRLVERRRDDCDPGWAFTASFQAEGSILERPESIYLPTERHFDVIDCEHRIGGNRSSQHTALAKAHRQRPQPAGDFDIVDHSVTGEPTDAIEVVPCFEINLGEGDYLRPRWTNGSDRGVTKQDGAGNSQWGLEMGEMKRSIEDVERSLAHLEILHIGAALLVVVKTHDERPGSGFGSQHKVDQGVWRSPSRS